MSSPETNVEPQSKKQSKAMRVAIGICGVVAMVLGVGKMYQGIKEIRGSSGLDPQVQRLLAESDKAVEDANKLLKDVRPRFQELMSAVDQDGLEPARTAKQKLAEEVKQEFAKAGGTLREAAKELDEASGEHIKESLKPYLAEKARSYRLLADAADQNVEMVGVVMDKSITKVDDLLPKVNALVAKREDLNKQSAAASAKADEIIKQITGKKQ